MTIFGIDISNNQGPDIDMAQVRAEGFDFVFCKVTEGSGFVDATWPGYRDAAKAAGLLVAGYHYLHDSDDINDQAQLFVSNLGAGIPAMVDFEAGSGTMTNFWAFANACNALGVRIALSYIPRWYWQQIGESDLEQTPGLIQSSYVPGTGYASVLYPGDDSPGWTAYGDRSPDVLQFTDSALVAGYTVDANAFRGTRDQLAALLNGTTPTPGGDMQLTDTITDAYNNQVTVADVLKWISFHADKITDAVGGPGARLGLPPTQKDPGHPALGGDTLVTAVARIGQKLGLAGYDPTKA